MASTKTMSFSFNCNFAGTYIASISSVYCWLFFYHSLVQLKISPLWGRCRLLWIALLTFWIRAIGFCSIEHLPEFPLSQANLSHIALPLEMVVWAAWMTHFRKFWMISIKRRHFIQGPLNLIYAVIGFVNFIAFAYSLPSIHSVLPL